LRYFRHCLKYSHSGTILIFDDINWSAGMQAAWLEMTTHEAVKLAIGLYRIGILFLSDELKKKEYLELYF
jgi:hypothetical protein